MSLEKTSCEDLKAFERRLQEIVNGMNSDTRKYRLALAFTTAFTTYGAFQWLTDPLTSRISLLQSLLNHPFFTINAIILILLFALTSIHKKVISPQVIMARARQVLSDFNMTCDDHGRLVLKPRPKPKLW
ncbi:nuclear envelope phosphatase-regulatory subunit 1-like [Panonychus citri]|uniref:nuclear envelope phosphatase-regulatory subunit 1-like n=1 Tax=Panonychus citri TaxID=50023 RepID=UPI002306E2B4|nr:nuclear envelope phosphatase-regulatory subunit 1-like [Panonychus citri]XP_053214342.1 nuclear envelope phosphatase-regulatory subunit 1-like [Panonychus citri]